MSTVTATDTFFGDWRGLTFEGITDGWFGAYYDPNLVVVAQGGVSFVFRGTGFASLDDQGFAQKGTVTQWEYWGGNEVILGISDISLKAGKLRDAFVDGGDDALFFKLMYSGDDHFTCGKSGDGFKGYGGDDIMDGSKSADILAGDSGDDTLDGAGGADSITGGGGGDTLSGGGDADTFLYFNTSASQDSDVDTITDLHNEDTISLSHIDAIEGTGTNDAFTVVASFSGAAGELKVHYNAGRDRTVIEGDTDGDANADLTIYVSGKHLDAALLL